MLRAAQPLPEGERNCVACVQAIVVDEECPLTGALGGSAEGAQRSKAEMRLAQLLLVTCLDRLACSTRELLNPPEYADRPARHVMLFDAI